ncbi:beta-eliminating lyase-related protein [Flavobacteriaceae bacterium]|nr:beta-eliminating lyase-related protein [Flavobacteriaceae bacterium]
MKVNLISDTVTLPSPGMLDAMQNAKVGDDVFKEDPAVNALEDKVAQLFGKEAALFFPSGTMANQTAIKIHTQPGEQLICDHYAHVFNYEGGGVSFNSGVSCALIEGERGRITAAQVASKINPPDFYHSPLSTLVCLENTTNKGGGAFYDLKAIKAIRLVCDEHQLGLHLDGARIWNALVASGQDAKSYGTLFDTISVCFSKGLGAPVGSALIGSKASMEKALRVRKVFGGGMRQAGFLAAAASYAIDHQWESLSEDHRKAKELKRVLDQLPYIKKVEAVDTNIVIFKLLDTTKEADFMNKMQEHEIRFISMGQGKLRMVTHRDYTQEQHQYVLDILQKLNF